MLAIFFHLQGVRSHVGEILKTAFIAIDVSETVKIFKILRSPRNNIKVLIYKTLSR